MKNTKKCPECDSQNTIRIPGNVGPYGVGTNIIVGITTIGAVKVTKYMCCECGYLEEWVDDKKDIEKIIKYYK